MDDKIQPEARKPREPKKKKPEQGMLFGEADLLVQTLARLITNTAEDIERREAAIDGSQAKLDRLYSMKTDLLRAQKIAVRQRDSLKPADEKKSEKEPPREAGKRPKPTGKAPTPTPPPPKEGVKKPKDEKGEPQKAKP